MDERYIGLNLLPSARHGAPAPRTSAAAEDAWYRQHGPARPGRLRGIAPAIAALVVGLAALGLWHPFR